MIKYIDLSKSQHRVLPFFDKEQAVQFSSSNKGWTFSSVYHFSELKNVFIALKRIHYRGIDDFYTKAISSGLPFAKTPWDSRRLLEHLNALINFELITKEYEVTENHFWEESYSKDISYDDTLLFSRIYHQYFRFKEIHSWLLNPVQADHMAFLNGVSEETLSNNSRPIFPFICDDRFNDAFIFSLEDNTDVFRIPKDKENKNGALMRFWDVFVKWGQALNLLQKFSLKNLDYELSNNNMKSFSCVYYVNNEPPQINLLEFIKSECQGNNIHIPQLILKIALRYRYRIDDIKRLVIEQALADSNNISLQRTSEIFIRGTEIDFVPQYKDSYISHLLLQ